MEACRVPDVPQRGALPVVIGRPHPLTFAGGHTVAPADLRHVRRVSHCRELGQLPLGA